MTTPTAPTAVNESIVLEVLRVGKREILGVTEALSVAVPCKFSNAKGNLREVNSFKDISAKAAQSASSFLAAIAFDQKAVANQ